MLITRIEESFGGGKPLKPEGGSPKRLEDIGNMETALRQAHPEKFSTKASQ